jgi:hypothetical protein
LFFPLNQAINVNLDSVLSFQALNCIATGYKVFIGVTLPTEPTLITDITNYNPTLYYGTTYLWRVVAFNDSSEGQSSEIWSFTTQDNPLFSVSPSLIDFGCINGLEAGFSQTFSITNTGGNGLVIHNISLSGEDFELFRLFDPNSYPNMHDLPITLIAGESLVTAVSFYPESVGDVSATIVINCNCDVTAFPQELHQFVIARSEATKQSSLLNNLVDCHDFRTRNSRNDNWKWYNTAGHNICLSRGVHIVPVIGSVYIPFSPQNFDVVGGDRIVLLTWNAPEFGGLELEGYVVYRFETDNPIDSLIEIPFGLINEFVDSDVVIGREYGYEILAVYDIEVSTRTEAVYITPFALNIPIDLAAEAGDREVLLSWDTPEYGFITLTGYKLYREDEPLLALGLVNEYTDAELTNDQTYTYQISALYGDFESVRSIEVSATPSVTSLLDEMELPVKTELLGNYPNPFNPNTIIRYSLASDSQVKIEVFNIKGQRVKTLVDGYLKAGRHQVEWDGTDGNNHSVSSGVYLYRLVTNQGIDIKRMVLLK